MMDFNDFKEKFGEWADVFKPFIESEEMFKIYEKIKSDAQKEVIVPSSDFVFRSFEESSPRNIRVIFYLMDPYPRRYRGRQKINQATGIPMDCSNSPDGKLQPSLNHFYDAMEKDLGEEVERSANLDYLLHQGCLLLNTDLTCKLNKTGSHEGLWESFQKFFLEEIMRGKQCIYVLCGKASHKMEKYISPLGNTIIKLDHPAYAERTHTDWDCKNIFTRINKILKDNGQEPIYWDRRVWQADLPF